jgi:hypothetical protein
MPVLVGPWPVGAHDAAAGTGPGGDVGKRVLRQQGLAVIAAVKRQQTVGLDGRWQHVHSARPALEGVHCKVRAIKPIRCVVHTVLLVQYGTILIYIIFSKVEACSIIGAVYVRMRQTMPRSLRYPAAMYVYNWWRHAQTTAIHTRSALRRRGGARAVEFKMGENHIPGKVRWCSPHQLIMDQWLPWLRLADDREVEIN